MLFRKEEGAGLINDSPIRVIRRAREKLVAGEAEQLEGDFVDVDESAVSVLKKRSMGHVFEHEPILALNIVHPEIVLHYITFQQDLNNQNTKSSIFAYGEQMNMTLELQPPPADSGDLDFHSKVLLPAEQPAGRGQLFRGAQKQYDIVLPKFPHGVRVRDDVVTPLDDKNRCSGETFNGAFAQTHSFQR